MIYELPGACCTENKLADFPILARERPEFLVPERIGNEANVSDVIRVGWRSVFETKRLNDNVEFR